MDWMCKNHPNRFCYICGHVVLPDCQAKITDFVKKAYQAYLGVRIRDQDKSCAPQICCKTCRELKGLEEQKKEEYAIWCPNGVEGRERSCNGLLLLHDKCKRHQLQEQAPC